MNILVQSLKTEIAELLILLIQIEYDYPRNKLYHNKLYNLVKNASSTHLTLSLYANVCECRGNDRVNDTSIFHFQLICIIIDRKLSLINEFSTDQLNFEVYI